jgi:hypothetical protein
MIDERERFEEAFELFDRPEPAWDRLIRRRDRKRRNQRIAAGVVGIAVFVAAIWIVTSGLSLDRSEKSVAPAGEVTGPAETAPPARASAAPDVVNRGWCGIVYSPAFQRGEARWWLGLTHVGDRIRVRFEVHRSAPGHRWTIRIFRQRSVGAEYLVFHGTSVASVAGDFVVQRFHRDNNKDGFTVRAKEWQGDQECEAHDWIG